MAPGQSFETLASQDEDQVRNATWRTARECYSHTLMHEDSPASPEPPDHTTPRLAFLVLALCFLLMALARGMSETFTVFLLPISTEFGWDRAQTVSVYSIGALCVGLAAPFVGRLFDHSGPRAVYAWPIRRYWPNAASPGADERFAGGGGQ